jgi:hypothetical protein
MVNQIHIIGPFNTGTNLMFKIINNSECIDTITNTIITTNDTSNVHNPFNKHILNMSVFENYLNNPDNLLIIMYKNIYNWLYSIKKESYDITYTKLYLPVELYGKQHTNMIELYNYYYVNYMSILERYKNVIFIDYRKIIDCSTSYDYINNKIKPFNLRLSSYDKFYKTLMTKAKDHGNPVSNSNEANEKYLVNRKLVQSFLECKPLFKKSIKNMLLNYFEN